MMRTNCTNRVLALLVASVAPIGCAAGAPPQAAPATPVCTESVGLIAKVSAIEVGERKVAFSVFPQGSRDIAERPPGDAPLLKARFFRQSSESSELSLPGQELRLYAPATEPVARAVGEPVRTPFGVARDVHEYEATVSFDKPGTWGVEVFVKAPWQLSPALTTVMFQVAPHTGTPVASSDTGRERVIYLGPCVGSHVAFEG